MQLTFTSDDAARDPVEVTGPAFDIGRTDDCDLVLDDEKVSRRHARIEVLADGRARIEDLGSSNGTFVNGTRITEPTLLAGGETVRLGDTELTVVAGAPATVVAPSLPSPPAADATAPRPIAPDLPTPPSDATAPRPLAPDLPTPPPDTTAPRPLGRSTIQRIVEQEVREEIAVEERRMRRTTRVALALAALAVAAAAAIAALFATGTLGGSSGNGKTASVAALERATVLVTGLDSNGNALYIGSGSIVRKDGYILTNAHVGKPTAPGLAVEYGPGTEPEAAALMVSLFEGEAKPAKAMYLAKPVAWDGYVDVAVLKIVKTLDGKTASGLNLPTVPVGDSSTLRDGDPVTVIGYPGVGGGFEGEINVSRGTVSGFQREPHIPGLRAWIKTDAAIAHGNSGGLAADSKGRLIGVPSRIQCGSSLFGSCNSSDDRQGKIRPIALALPVIRAAEAGRSWRDPYLVTGTGRERFDFLGWAATRPDSSCRAQRVSGSSAVETVYGVFDASEMTPGEDIDAVVGYRADATAQPSYNQTLLTWARGNGTRNSCYWISFPANHGAGVYSLQLLVGPSLAKATDELSVRLG